MRKLARCSATVAAGLVTVLTLGTSPVAALSCMSTAEATPESFADGTAMLYEDVPFLGGDTYVLIGEIHDRLEASGPAEYQEPPPQVTIRVAAAIGRDTVGAAQVLSNDPTWGWNWPVGEQRLFVVWQSDGRSPELDVCHPGLPIVDPDTLAAELEPIAEAAGTPFARPDTTSPAATSGPNGTAPQGPEHGPAIVAAAGALALVIAAVSRLR